MSLTNFVSISSFTHEFMLLDDKGIPTLKGIYCWR